jgi:hypothetical protein
VLADAADAVALLGDRTERASSRAITSVKMIDRTYGHLVAGADAYERKLLDAFDAQPNRELGRAGGPRLGVRSLPSTKRAPQVQGFWWERERRDSNPRPPA